MKIENFRGIRLLSAWNPAPEVNCLIGPGDSTKTTILDAIELCLNPRSYFLADDCDFFQLDIDSPIRITVTLTDLPVEFKAEDRYGLFLRGWDKDKGRIEDEPGAQLEDALSILVEIDKSLEARWSIFNDRISSTVGDPPVIRYKDFGRLATNRLGPYAERHLSWGRTSILPRIAEAGGRFSINLAEARRAARQAFRNSDRSPFEEAAKKAEKLSKLFSVPVQSGYRAELDLDGASISSGGIALHDGQLPLRRLGTGSSRLIVSALQHGAGSPNISIIDEIEHGLEPHRIARLLKFLKTPKEGGFQPQVFLTSHSPSVIIELDAKDIYTVRSSNGHTTVHSAAGANASIDAQSYLRASPEAFLARRVIVGEGRTEQGLVRGLDTWWSQCEKSPLALLGVAVIDGRGTNAVPISEHLLDLGYEIFLLHDTDIPFDADGLRRLQDKRAAVEGWHDRCAIEERVFLDVPWEVLLNLLDYAVECEGADSVLAVINQECCTAGIAELETLPPDRSLDGEPFRRVLGKAAKSKKRPWFKTIERGERLGEIVGPILKTIAASPFAQSLERLRKWLDA